MSMEYIRRMYNVPAKRGMRVRFVGPCVQFDGTIVSSRGGYLRVRSDDNNWVYTLHPAWNVQYLEDEKK